MSRTGRKKRNFTPLRVQFRPTTDFKRPGSAKQGVDGGKIGQQLIYLA